MPYTEPHILFTVQGDAYGQTETWQFGVRCRATPVGGLLDLDSLVNAMAAPTQTFFTGAGVGVSFRHRLVSLKAAYILATGLYPEDLQPAIYTYVTPPLGAGGTPWVPQATLAVTLLTNIPRGRASRGRFFMPPLAYVLGADGRMTESQVDNVEQAAKIWLNALRGTAQISEILVMSKLGEGKTGVVNAIGGGRVVDTMRSRRRSLKEERTNLPL